MLGPIASTRNIKITIQNALVGAVNVTKNADIQKINLKDVVYALMKGVLSVKVILIMEETY